MFSFMNPVKDKFGKVDFKTMNNDIVINSLKNHFGIDARASGRNDLIVEDGKKVSGSAYKLK